MFKQLLRGLTSQLFKFCIIFLALSTAIIVVFGNPNKLKSSLKTSGIFDSAVDNILDESQKQTDKRSEDVPLSDPGVRQAAKKAFSGEFLEKQSTTLIDGVYSWLDGNSAKPDFILDFKDAKVNLANGIGDVAVARIKSLKPCTAKQLVALDRNNLEPFSVPCRPADIDLKAERARLVSQIIKDDGFLKDTKITSDDLPKNTQGETIFEQAHEARSVYHGVQKLPWVLGIVGLLSAGAFIALHDERRRGILLIARTLLISGILLAISALIVTYVANHISSLAKTDGNQLQESAIALGQSLIQAFTRVLLIFGAIYAIAGVMGLGALHFTQTKPHTEGPPKPPTKPEQETIEKPKQESKTS